MDVEKVIEKRRGYRSLEEVKITDETISALAKAAQLAPSCFNNQPTRYVFVFDSAKLTELHTALPNGNAWAKKASLIIAVFSRKEDDCVIGERIYHQFDVGLATGFLILRATELGLVAHPIAGYDPDVVKEVLAIPEDYEVIALVNVGKRASSIDPILSEKQVEAEKERPARLSIEEFVYLNRFGGE
ncbi:MAG: nitroreductase family protein [Candidatus Altiarchaeota archaeon]